MHDLALPAGSAILFLGDIDQPIGLQPDGMLVIGGTFQHADTRIARNRIARLNEDGWVDPTFDPDANGEVLALAVQTDGKILVGGSFGTLGGQARNYIGRLNEEGTLDSEFNPGASSTVYSLAVQADGKILVGGSFTSLGGQARNRIARCRETRPGGRWRSPLLN